MAKKKTDEAPPEKASTDLAAEFAELGRAIRNAIESAWKSEERENLQEEISSGLRQMADEMEKAAGNIRQSDAGQKVEDKAKQMRDDVTSGKLAEDLREGMATALRGARDAMDRAADSFTEGSKPEVEFEPLDMDKGK